VDGTIWDGLVAGGLTAAAAFIGTIIARRGQSRDLRLQLEQRAREARDQLEQQTAELTRELEQRAQAAREQLAQQTTLLTRQLEHADRLMTRELEHQTRAALRRTYNKLLVVQRQSREASLDSAKCHVDENDAAQKALKFAEDAHTRFVEHYHQLNLDANREMWREARRLRRVLDDMLQAARDGDAAKAEALHTVARHARQNLEGSFRARLGLDTLQPRKPLGEYDRERK
jgi:hypothetical protein